MNRLKPLSALLGAALILSGCSSVDTADELARLQAPDPLASRARSLMAVFDFDVPDRAPDGSAVVLQETEEQATTERQEQRAQAMRPAV